MSLEFRDMPGFLIRRLHQISVSIFDETCSSVSTPITQVQYAALSAIQARPDIDQATLAGLIAYDRVTIGGVLERLVQKKLVERSVSHSDRRARVLTITDQGNSLLTELNSTVPTVQSTLLQGLTPEERTTFTQLLQKATNATNNLSRAPMSGTDRDKPSE